MIADLSTAINLCEPFPPDGARQFLMQGNQQNGKHTKQWLTQFSCMSPRDLVVWLESALSSAEFIGDCGCGLYHCMTPLSEASFRDLAKSNGQDVAGWYWGLVVCENSGTWIE